MEPATFIATAIAGAILKEVATDTYKAIKKRLVATFALETSLRAVEEKPDAESARAFLAASLAESNAARDPEVASAAGQIADELAKLPDDTRLGANLTVRNIKAATAEFRRIAVRPGGAADFTDIEVKGKFIAEDIEVGDDRKR